MQKMPLVSSLVPIPCIIGLLMGLSSDTFAQWSPEQDQDYIKRFHEKFKPVSPAPKLDDYANPARYDALYLGEPLKADIIKMGTDSSSLAWGWSYRMISLNEMYRHTRDPKYLQAHLEIIRAVIERRDDKQGVKLWTGKIATAWGSGAYAERGRAIFAVHTGVITHPIFDCLSLIKQEPHLLKELRDELGDEFDTMRIAAEEAIAWHDRQWREGPAKDEGYYIGMDQEQGLEGKPLPGNRLSAMGRALWASWKLSGNTIHRDRALAIGRYIRNRISLGEDGAWYWSYALPSEPVSGIVKKDAIPGEDISHGALTMALPMILAAEGQVFNASDMARLGKTATQGFGRLGNGVLLAVVNGDPAPGPGNVQLPARWLQLTPFAPETYRIISEHYLNYIPTPGPLDMALLIIYRP